MNTQREQLIQTWITSVLGSDQFETHFLAGDASFRRYARIKLNNKTFMLMDAPPEKEGPESHRDCVSIPFGFWSGRRAFWIVDRQHRFESSM